MSFTTAWLCREGDTVRPDEEGASVIAVLPNGIELAYETFGDSTAPAIVLVAGFGAQMISWDDGFCTGLAERGRFVIRFDNRDSGLSTKLDQPVDLGEVVAAAARSDLEAVRALAPYSLAEMADDVAMLVSSLGLGEAHVVGTSMGGMIAQLVAIRHRPLVRTLTSMSSSTGSSEVGESTPEAFGALMRPPAAHREKFIEDSVSSARVWSSKRYFDGAAAARLAAASYDRGYCPPGTARQLAALLGAGSLERDLAALDVPALVIHGLDDTLVTPSGGRRTAEVIPGAELLMLTDMGHDRPVPLWPKLWDAVIDHTAETGRRHVD